MAGEYGLAALTARASADLEQASAAGDLQAIADAVELFEQVEDLARREGHPEYLTSVINLVNALIRQAETGGSDEPLDRALHLLDFHEQALQGSSLDIGYLMRKGKALLMRAQRTGSKPMMAKAVRVQKERIRRAPKGHLEHEVSMFDLGVTLLHSGSMFDNLADLSEAVAVLESVRRRPGFLTSRAAVLSALGNARLERFLSVTRRPRTELDIALEEHKEAMEALELDDPEGLTYLSDFGAAFMRAYERTRDRRSLDASVEAQRGAAEQTPAGHIRKAERLNNLAFALLTLHEDNGDPGTLDEAISTSRAAAATAYPHHAHRASCLYGLAYGLFRRGELRRTLLDFDEAAVLAGDAVEATTDGHTHQATRLAFYAQTLCFLPSVAKLRKADEDLALAAGRLRHDDPNRALIQSNHGALLEALADFLGDGSEEQRHCAKEAVRLTREAVGASEVDQSEYSGRLLNFVGASATLAALDRNPAILNDPLLRCETAEVRPGTGLSGMLLELGRASAMACQYELTGESGLAAAAVVAYQRAVADVRLPAFRRLDAARAGAGLAARSGDIASGLDLYSLAIDLLDGAAWRGIERRDQERLLAQYGGLPADAAATAITAGQPEAAIDLLERGRGVLLDRLFDDDADLERLRQVDPARADQFDNIRHDLERIVIPDLEADDFNLPLRQPEQASEADLRSALARRLDDIINQIRALPGCSDLFRPPSVHALQAALGTRSVAVINISDLRCDALIVTVNGLTVTPLPDLTKEDTERAAEFFRTRAEQASRQDSAGLAAREELADKLKWLWDAIAEPILNNAGMTDAASAAPEVPRLHWCAVGPAAFLPLHAAGRHGESGPTASQAVIDRIESVYIPKLRTLARNQMRHSASEMEPIGPPLIVSMPDTPGLPRLPNADAEAEHLLSIFPTAEHLTEAGATRGAVLAAMKTHHWFHFAVHGVTDDHTPLGGGLQLTDGRLTIRELARQQLPGARFGYLSACATYQGSPEIPDEAISVGTALCIAGCRTVIAAQWRIADTYTADFARHMYEHLVTRDKGTPVLDPGNAPKALRDTARSLRDAHPDQPERWAPFICTAR